MKPHISSVVQQGGCIWVMFVQGLKFVFICILIFKFYIVHSITLYDAIFATSLASKGKGNDVIVL